MWMYQSKTHRQPANFITLHCVAVAFERLSCFNKIKQEITHYDCFNPGVSNIRPTGQNRPVPRLNVARGMILQSKNFLVCLRSLSSYTSITGD